MVKTLDKRYRPKQQADPDLDIGLKTAFDQIYSTQDQWVAGVGNNLQLASGSALVTGSQTGLETGLATVTNIVATIDNEDSALNEWVSARPTPRGKGLIDLYVWKPTAAGSTVPIASTTERTVRWIAIGTRSQGAA